MLTAAEVLEMTTEDGTLGTFKEYPNKSYSATTRKTTFGTATEHDVYVLAPYSRTRMV